MAFKLLSTLSESVKADEQHRALLEEITVKMFGDNAAASYADYLAAWERGTDHPTGLTEEIESAAKARAGELDWVRNAADTGEDATAAKLGIGNKTPATGDYVALGAGGIGQIVDVDDKSASVIIRGKSGNEKVFKNSDLIGPKMVNGKRAWALHGS